MKSTFKRIAGKIVWFSCWLIIFSAVLLNMARLLTPTLDRHREQFAYLAGKALEHPVVIGKLSASWYHFEPVFKFEDVIALDVETNQPLLKIKELIVGIDLLKSLWHWRLDPDILILNGSKLVIEQSATGQLTINGAKTTQDTTGASLNFTNVLHWLFSHGQLVLKDVDLTVRLRNQPQAQFEIQTVNLTNQGKRHYLNGDIILRQKKLTPIHFAADLTTGKTLAQIENARLYLSIRRLQLDKLAIRTKDQVWQTAQGIMAAQVWADWNKEGWQRLQSQITIRDLLINFQQKNLAHVNRLVGNFLVEKQKGDGWKFSGDKLQLTIDDHSWPENKFEIITTEQEGQTKVQQLQIAYLNLSDLLAFSKCLPEKYRIMVQALQPRGEISPLFWQQTSQGMRLAGQFQNIEFKPWQHIPGVTGLTGKLKLLPTNGVLELSGHHTQLDFVKFFPKPLVFDRLMTRFDIQKQEGGWLFTSSNLKAINSDLALRAAISLQLPKDNSSPTMQLIAGIKAANANHASAYYPVGIMHQPLIDWLNTAIIQAKDITGTMAWRGALADFPYHKPTGVFSVNGRINEATLAYHEGWPAIKQLAADLNFTGKSMQITAEKGSILGSKLQAAQAIIEDMSAHPSTVLQVEGKIQGDAKQAMAFIQQSPLKASIGKSLRPFNLQGDMQTKLWLTIPLAKHDAEIKITGQSELNNASLKMPSWDLQLDKLNGQFSYSEMGLQTGQLTGLLMNEPMQIAITSEAIASNGQETQIKMSGELTAKALSRYFNWIPKDKLSGHTTYAATLKLKKIAQQPMQQILQLTTNLKNLAFSLPEPFAKTAEQLKPLTITLAINEHIPNLLTWNYDKQLTGKIELHRNSQNNLLMQGVVIIGNKALGLINKPGLFILGKLAEFDWQVWQSWLEPWLKSVSQQDTNQQYLQGIRLHIGKIMAFNQVFEDAVIRLSSDKQTWNLAIDSNAAQGSIILPQAKQKQPIVADFKRLHLQKNSLAKVSTKVNAKTIPAIHLNCQDCRYGEKHLGSLQLNAEPNQAGLLITKLVINNPAFILNLSGSWRQLVEQEYTQVVGKLLINDLAATLQALAIPPAMSAKQGEVSFNLDWLGKPYDLKLANLKGEVNLNLGRGQLTTVNSAAAAKIGLANLINILSVESLARKLTLDFRDLTTKGFNFNKMQGNFKLNNGNAYTSNAYFDGNVAYLGFKGRLGLVKKDYNLALKIVPYVTASLPIIATLAGGPIVGAVSLVADKLIKREIDQASPYNYSLTGSWEQPHIEKFKN